MNRVFLLPRRVFCIHCIEEGWVHRALLATFVAGGTTSALTVFQLGGRAVVLLRNHDSGTP